jgi:vitamin B12 transporter
MSSIASSFAACLNFYSDSKRPIASVVPSSRLTRKSRTLQDAPAQKPVLMPGYGREEGRAMTRAMRALGVVFCVVAVMVGAAQRLTAQAQGGVSGEVVDALGARVAGAAVTLMRDGSQVAQTKTTAEGRFTFQNVEAGRYQVSATAQGFQSRTSESVYAGAGVRPAIVLALEVGTLHQDVVVTAEAGAVLQSQTGAPVTVIDSATLEALNKPDVLEALRLVPGAQIVQVGERGGGASLFLRGGNSNFTKVLIDGVPANDIGGFFDFSLLDVAGVERIEVLRQTNSVVYGSDALTGVVNITTRRGSSRVPEFEYAIDGGSLGTFRNSLSLGGAVKRFDYFSQYSYFTTDNHTANSGYERSTFAGRFGVAAGGGTNISGTLRWMDGRFEGANAISLFGIPDDATTDSARTYVSITADSHITNRWQSTIRFGSAGQRSVFVNPTPTGEAFDPFGFGANYLGQTVTLTGANGASVTGRAILDFGGTFPVVSDLKATRRSLFGQTTYEVMPELTVSGGARWDREEGFDGDVSQVVRNNGGAFVEARASVMNRAYLSGGVGLERNDVFGTEAVPRFSAAVYLRNPSAQALGETKVSFNIGKGIKGPSVFQEQSALFELVQGTSAGAGVSPVGPEKSRGFDVAVEQGFASGQARARVGYFNNEFEGLLEFLNQTALVRAGVSADVAAATAFGAYINSQSYDAQGLELSVDAAIGQTVRFGGSYTYLDAEVTEAFSASASTNPAFPGVPIGAFSPLVGERPFRRPANSGTLFVSVSKGRAQVALSAYFAGTRDDTTFLSDAFFGNSMLLPNQDLAAAYQKVDLSVSYRVHRQAKIYTSIENLFDKQYEAAFGFPSLPFAIRAGLTATFGGDR